MEDPHKRIHDRALAALHAHAEGNARAMLQAVAEMESASMGVLEGLERMASGGEENPNILCNH